MSINYTEISPRVRKLVRWLNDNGFQTTDSGDGSHHAEGMECAVPHPMVAISVDPLRVVSEAERLRDALSERFGILFQNHPEAPNIEASYSPVDGLAFVVLLNVTDAQIAPIGGES